MEVRETIAQYLVDKKSTKEANSHKCELCLATFSTKTKIINHMKYHLKYTYTLKGSRNAPCTECGKMMKRKKMGEHVCTEELKTVQPQPFLLATTTSPLKISSLSPMKTLVPTSTETIGTNSSSEPMLPPKRKTIFSPPPSTPIYAPTLKQIVKITQQTTKNISPEPKSQSICSTCEQGFKESCLLATHMKKHLKQKLNRDLNSGQTSSQKKAKCVCPGCLLQSCGDCQTCRNKHLKKRCLLRQCLNK